MFDDSFQLSEQYFTVLQLLRIFQDWIDEAEKGIDKPGKELSKQCESWHAWQKTHSPLDEEAWHLDLEILESNFSQVRGFFNQRVSSIRDRLQKKRDEVQSLRDGVCSDILITPYTRMATRFKLTRYSSSMPRLCARL